jgi:hypothetical protein
MAKKKAPAKKATGRKQKVKKSLVTVDGRKLHIFQSGDNSPIIIDDGGSLRIKQRNQRLLWDNAGNVALVLVYTKVRVVQLKFDGTILLNGVDVTTTVVQNFNKPGVLRISSGSGTLTAQDGTDENGNTVTVMTLSKGTPDEKKDDPKKPNQFRYISKDKGDISAITFDGAANNLVFDDTVSNTTVILLP